MNVACKDHIQKFFILTCISCLDKYMSIWMDKSKFSVFAFFPSKPHPKGNKYRIVCFSESCFMYSQ